MNGGGEDGFGTASTTDAPGGMQMKPAVSHLDQSGLLPGDKEFSIPSEVR